MTVNSSFPRLVFHSDHDERSLSEAADRGYLSHVSVEFQNGSRVPVYFYDPVRLQQDLEVEVASGSGFIAEPGMIVIPEVTLANMEKAVAKLYREGFFSNYRSQRVPAQLTELSAGLRSQDPKYCGEAPRWIVETVQKNLDNLIFDHPPQNLDDEQVKTFALGSIKFVADGGGSDCDVLLNALDSLLTS